MSTSPQTPEQRFDGLVRYIKGIPADDTDWTTFRDFFLPTMHQLDTAGMDLQMSVIDGFLFNNMIGTNGTRGISTECVSHLGKIFAPGGGPGDLGYTTLSNDKKKIVITVFVGNHKKNDFREVFLTLVHEMIHAICMGVLGNSDEGHGVIWQPIAMAVEETLERCMGSFACMQRELAVDGDIKEGECPHLNVEDVQRFFGDRPDSVNNTLLCPCVR